VAHLVLLPPFPLRGPCAQRSGAATGAHCARTGDKGEETRSETEKEETRERRQGEKIRRGDKKSRRREVGDSREGQNA